MEVQEKPVNRADSTDLKQLPECKEGSDKPLSVSDKDSLVLSCIDTAVKPEEKSPLIKVIGIVDDIPQVTNCDNSQSVKEEETLVKDNDQNNCNVNNKCDVQNIEKKSDILSSSTGRDIQKLDAETNNETPAKAGNNSRRKRKNVLAQETELSQEDGSPRTKRKKVKNTTDKFCWRCHKESVDAQCTACPRSWHRRCMGGMSPVSMQNWICGECAAILKAENAETRSTAMAQLSVDQLCLLLKHVVERMRDYPGSEPFWNPVQLSEAPNYLDYVVKPMDLSLLESNVRSKLYGSTDAFMADAKWIQHNCIVFNTCGGVYTDTSKLTNAAKQIIKLARQEVSEIEACPDCYAHGRNIPRPQPSWFIEPCRRPHPLVWAKLKGFPFWPAKAMPRVNSQGYVDVRFFGEHDRAWVSPRDMYLYSEDPPVPLPRKRKIDMDECVREITRHCRKLELVFGQFKFAPSKIQYNPNDPMQIKLLLPNYDPMQSNDFMSPLFSTAKKRVSLKKRASLPKGKNQSDIKIGNSNLNINSSVDDDLGSVLVPDATEKKSGGVNRLSKSAQPEIVANDSEDLSIISEVPYRKETDDIQQKVERKKTKLQDIEKQESDLNANSSKPKISVLKTGVNNSASKGNVGHLNADVQQDKSLGKVVNIDKPTNQIKQPVTSPNRGPVENTVVQQKEATTKGSNLTTDTPQNTPNAQKQNVKTSKSVIKVYKPKTRMVDKVNAERALKSTSLNEQVGKANTDDVTAKPASLQNSAEVKESDKNTSNNKTLALPPISSVKLTASSVEASAPSQPIPIAPKVSTNQSVALLLVANSGVSESLKQATPVTDKQRINDTPSIAKEGTKDVIQHKKESRAKKTFPNKPRPILQNAPRAITNSSSNVLDPLIYVPGHQTEQYVGYQMIPPEAGPLSAHLYNGAQDLARKMAQLMEEAYKEAAQDTQNVEDGSSENHQATVHFLRLQVERMRWQHQQQLAELKHNTDRILREMRTSLEAERLRAIEETRWEAEQQKMRCIEETKRKQWCAMCGREALFYCCWNTAYCDYPCQQSHWPTHMRTCAQQPSFTTIVTSSAANSNQQQVMPRLMINSQHVSSNMWRA